MLPECLGVSIHETKAASQFCDLGGQSTLHILSDNANIYTCAMGH